MTPPAPVTFGVDIVRASDGAVYACQSCGAVQTRWSGQCPACSAWNTLVEELTSQRAEDRIGETVEVLVESVGPDGVEGRAAHQGPEVDGTTTLVGAGHVTVGDLVSAVVVSAEGADLVARPEVAR